MPIPNVYTATEDPTSQVGNNGDIYFHTGLIGLSPINVYKKVNGRWGLTGSISTGAGAILSANIARVDQSGNDGTGTVGDLNKPFLTVQAAINAIQSGSFTLPIVDIGNNVFTENITTSLSAIQFIGSGQPNQPFNSITFTEPTAVVTIYFSNINSCGDASPNIIAATSADLEVYQVSSYVHNITNSAGGILGFGFGSSAIDGTVSAPGFFITMHQFNPLGVINSAGSVVDLYDSKLFTLTAAASITLHDSRISANNAGITPTYSDILLKGLISGGTTGQVLAKASNTDFDVHWINP